VRRPKSARISGARSSSFRVERPEWDFNAVTLALKDAKQIFNAQPL
jgi:hypothetical protein